MTNRTPENTHHIDGCPRYAHKTTEGTERMVEDGNKNAIFCHNHTLCEEIIENHLGDSPYGPDQQRRVVHPQGKVRACGADCDHHPDGSDYYKYQNAAQEAIEEHAVVTPEVFEGQGICPYLATKEAVKYANWIVTVPQMISRIDDRVDWSEFSVFIDEESTQKKFYAQGGTLVNFKHGEDLFGMGAVLPEHDSFIGSSAIHNLGQRINSKLEDYDRIPGRYQLVKAAYDAFSDYQDTILQEFDLSNYDNPEQAAKALAEFDIPEIDYETTENEVNAAFTYIRQELGRYIAAPYLEAIITGCEIMTEQSQNQWSVQLIPDCESGFRYHRELFETCDQLYLVGDLISKHFVKEFMPGGIAQVERSYEEPDPVETDNLKIITMDGDEMDRRPIMTRIANELTQSGVHNLLLAGSTTRAKQAHNKIYPRSYLFQGGATPDDYEQFVDPVRGDEAWNVTSYMGSRLTRGVDVDTQVTVVRSAQFSSPMWKTHPIPDARERMSEYENNIELHNAMLRGAGQGEQHVAIIPSAMLRFGLEQHAETYEITDYESVVDDVLGLLKNIPDDLRCRTCGRTFFGRQQFIRHRDEGCEPDPFGYETASGVDSAD